MKDWDSKIVSVLSNYNVVEIKDQKELDSFKEICNRIGLTPFSKCDFDKLAYYAAKYDAQHNRTYSEQPIYYVGYRNDKGLGFYRDTKSALESWFGIAPFSMDELLEEIK
jgi:hypothetical protein